ncbi:MAG: hypothetical protein J6N15_13305 [Ruminiclostridium sp.]|nr:hypothetical protein [Ruminiclostridium sp.]
MSKTWETELLNELVESLSEGAEDIGIEDINGNDVLVMEYDSENGVEDCNIMVNHINEDSTEINVMVTLRSGLGEKSVNDVLSLLPYLNEYLTVGNFGITVQDGYFYFNTTQEIDEDMDRDKLLKMIGTVLDIAVNTSEEAMEMIAPVLDGERPAAELMNEDTAIIQF